MDNKFKPETLCVQAGWQPKKGTPCPPDLSKHDIQV